MLVILRVHVSTAFNQLTLNKTTGSHPLSPPEIQPCFTTYVAEFCRCKDSGSVACRADVDNHFRGEVEPKIFVQMPPA